MKFDKWAKDILIRELKPNDNVSYLPKRGWYSATSTGFLLRVELRKRSFGQFLVEYEIMPLVAPLFVSADKTLLTMGFPRDAIADYQMTTHIHNIDIYSLFRRNAIHLPEINETCAAIIRHYLNPQFESLSSYERYRKESITGFCRIVYQGLGDQEICALSKQLINGKVPDNMRNPDIEGNYPSNYPWYTNFMNQMPYVYAMLGRYEEALSKIRGQRQNKIHGIEFNFKMGFITKETFDTRIQEANAEDAEIEQAMATSDVALCRTVLDRNYQKNRSLIREHLGLDLPESY